MASPSPPDRCSFDAHARFAAFARELESALSSGRSLALPPTTRAAPRSPARRTPRFATLARGEAKLDRQAAAARQNAGSAQSPFREPTTHRFREASPARWRDGRDFVAKFALPSGQDLRRRSALSQQGFFGPAPGEDAPPVSHAFKEQMLQRQEPRVKSPAPYQPRSPGAFRVALRSSSDAQMMWPTG